jgi:transcriptional activator of cad operon
MSSAAKLRIGAWCVDPAAAQVSRDGKAVRIEARSLRLLLDLAEHAGEVVSIDELLDRVWAGVIVTPDSVYQAVASLRRLLGDDPRQPLYIATVPRLGYRLVAPVSPWTDDATPRRPRAGSRRLAVGAIAVAALLATLFVWIGAPGLPPARPPSATAPVSVGVMPFLDLTAADEVVLADDVTEGLVNQLGKTPGLRTPGFRSSFLLRGKGRTPAQAARALGVSYIVEGSVRLFGQRVRISARLIRPDTGFVIWVQTYDRPLLDVPIIQAAIAHDVARTLLEGKPGA